ncbi:Gfo/Idh/MocA family oxidoreductase [Paraflavisolibacter sp. H34]|uniref:Gfo/Idh/MocA family protein n=1 Tax=Huijunlia imazamoxiresistens TaxID=3127457 RepID=UPI00301A3ADE
MKFGIPLPRTSRPIYVIGAGGIVNDAHLPAYKLAGFDVAGIFDLDREKAAATACKFSIPHVFDSLEALLQAAAPEAVFDLALPAVAFPAILSQLPDGAAVLMQKPMGDNMDQATTILKLAREKNLVAGVNFQLRYAPMITAARNLINEGKLGELCDIELNLNVFTPWHIWKFLYGLPRVEILYHSIHYIDLVRSFLGNPKGMFAKTMSHPAMKELASVRTNMIMDYGDTVRANIFTNHCHRFGLTNQQSYIKFEGTEGAIKIKLGLLMNYPQGVPDVFEYVFLEEGKEPQWQTLDVEGSWFPHAFIGSMAQVMRAAEGSIARPDNSVEDCLHTMACVEAAYRSSEKGGVALEGIG